MKISIRRGVFETNSSSVHSLTMCSDDEYNKWKKGEILYNNYNDSFVTLDEALKTISDPDSDKFKEKFLDYDRFFRYTSYETFEDSYTTESGDVVHAFGYFGQDY